MASVLAPAVHVAFSRTLVVSPAPPVPPPAPEQVFVYLPAPVPTTGQLWPRRA